MKLRNILFLSDLVKFAKEHPLPNENEQSWTNAYEFVMATKKEEAISATDHEPLTTDKQQ